MSSLLDAVRKEYENVIFFDGGSRGNPGSGGCGAVLEVAGTVRWRGWAYLEDPGTTNNVAEYVGLLLGAKHANKKGLKRCVFCGDSKLIVNQMNGDWRCRDKKLAELRNLVLASLDGIDFHLIHIERALNADADAMANRAMDSKANGEEHESLAENLVDEKQPEDNEAAVLSYEERRRLLTAHRDASVTALQAIRDYADNQLALVDREYQAALQLLAAEERQ